MTGYGYTNMLFWHIVFRSWTEDEVKALSAWAREVEALREPVE